MRLLVHSIWQCNHEGCHGFPLKVELCEGEALTARREARGIADLTATKVIPQEFDPQLVLAMLEKIVEYDVFAQTAGELNLIVPPQRPDADADEQILRQLHSALFEFHVIEGVLTCPTCSRRYPISNGIPDFVQKEEN